MVKTRYNDWRVAVVDENGHQVIRESDALGRLVGVKEYTGTFGEPNWSVGPYATTNYTYDVKDQLVGVQDAAWNQTQIFYDMLGRKVGMSDPDMGVWSYAYDALGNLTRQADARGQRVCFYYDAMSRVVGKIYWSTDSCPVPGPYTPYNVVFQYDNALNDADAVNSWGKLRQAYVGSSPTTNGHEYKYDERGRTIWEKVWVDGVGYATSYTYDSMDRPKTMTYPDGEVVTYAYRPNGLLNTVVGTSVYVGETVYTAWGAVDLRKLGLNGQGQPVLQVDYSYYAWTGANGEGRGRLSRIAAGTPASPTSLLDLRYTDYDLVGNVKEIRDYKAGYPPYTSYQRQVFTYDDLNRLTSAKAEWGQYGNYALENYTYNEIGNLTSKGGVAYGYNGGKPHAVTHLAGAQKFWYDANGNQTKRIVGSDTYDLVYDAENRLVQVKKNGNTVATFVYGPSGERVKGTVNGVATVYVGEHYEVQGTTVRKYYYAGTQRVAMRENGTLYFLLTDHLGSTAITANGASGAKVAEVRYKAWGEDRYTSGTTPTTYRYTGQRWEAGLGLYFYRARWYDPALGRFTQPDLVVKTENPQSLNRFSYVLNNPLKYSDPSGNQATVQDTANYIRWRWGIEIIGDNWQVWELDWIIRGLCILSEEVGGDATLRDLLGISAGKYVRFERSHDQGQGIAQNGAVYSSRRGYVGSTVTFYDEAFAGDVFEERGNPQFTAYTVIHELAHVMDHFTGGTYSRGLWNATGGGQGTTLTGYGVGDPGEEWAESLAATLIPDVGRVQDWKEQLALHRRPFPTERENYVKYLLHMWSWWHRPGR